MIITPATVAAATNVPRNFHASCFLGVVSAVLKFAGVDWFLSGWAASNAAEWVGLAMYLVLIGYMGWHTIKAKSEK